MKRSVTIEGHRTSISLEEPFWDALGDIATAKEMPLHRLIAEVDLKRIEDPLGLNLSSALRVFILAHYRG